MIAIIVVLGVLLLGYFLFKKKISKVNEVDVKEIGAITSCCEAKAEVENEVDIKETGVILPIQEKIEEAKAVIESVKIEALKAEDKVKTEIKEIKTKVKNKIKNKK